MSRTYKDRPYRLAVREAQEAGYVVHVPFRPLFAATSAWYTDVDGYAYTRHNRRIHLPLRRFSDWRWIEGDWMTDHGDARQIRQHLKMACRDANSGLMSDDWDDPVVYQRRRRWYC